MFLHQGTQVIVIVINLKTKNRGVLLSYFSVFLTMAVGRLTMVVGG